MKRGRDEESSRALSSASVHSLFFSPVSLVISDKPRRACRSFIFFFWWKAKKQEGEEGRWRNRKRSKNGKNNTQK